MHTYMNGRREGPGGHQWVLRSLTHIYIYIYIYIYTEAIHFQNEQTYQQGTSNVLVTMCRLFVCFFLVCVLLKVSAVVQSNLVQSAQSNLLWSGLVWPNLVQSNLVQSSLVWPSLVQSNLVQSNPVYSSLVQYILVYYSTNLSLHSTMFVLACLSLSGCLALPACLLRIQNMFYVSSFVYFFCLCIARMARYAMPCGAFPVQ